MISLAARTFQFHFKLLQAFAFFASAAAEAASFCDLRFFFFYLSFPLMGDASGTLHMIQRNN